jgi:hypothetical protein
MCTLFRRRGFGDGICQVETTYYSSNGILYCNIRDIKTGEKATFISNCLVPARPEDITAMNKKVNKKMDCIFEVGDIVKLDENLHLLMVDDKEIFEVLNITIANNGNRTLIKVKSLSSGTEYEFLEAVLRLHSKNTEGFSKQLPNALMSWLEAGK